MIAGYPLGIFLGFLTWGHSIEKIELFFNPPCIELRDMLLDMFVEAINIREEERGDIGGLDEYFQSRGIIEFSFNGKSYTVYIEDVACFPQAYAAAATMLYQLVDESKAVILDIGGFTADYLLLKNGQADLSTCDSLGNGVILLYNRIRSKANAELDILMDENDVDNILRGKGESYPEAAVHLGGGAILLRRQIEASGKVGSPLFVSYINAKGYEYLYQIEMTGR